MYGPHLQTQNRHLVKQNQLLMQSREIDPDIRWMAVGIIMITTVTNMKASATKQQPKPQEKKQKKATTKKNVDATKNSKNQLCKTKWNNADWYPNQQLVSFFALVIAGEKLTYTLSCIRDTRWHSLANGSNILYITNLCFMSIHPVWCELIQRT